MTSPGPTISTNQHVIRDVIVTFIQIEFACWNRAKWFAVLTDTRTVAALSKYGYAIEIRGPDGGG